VIVLTLAAYVRTLARKVVVLLLEQIGSCEHRHHEAPESCHVRFLDLIRWYFQLLCYVHSLGVVFYENLSPAGSTVKHWVVQKSNPLPTSRQSRSIVLKLVNEARFFVIFARKRSKRTL